MKRGSLAFALLLLLGFAALLTINVNTVNNALSTISGGLKRRHWASMSLCWGENAKVFGKANFPYFEAAYYSSMLWHTQAKGGGDFDNCERPEKKGRLKAGFLCQ